DEISCARVAVRLKHRHEPRRVTVASRAQDCCNLGGMMAIVVDHGDPTLNAVNLVATLGAVEFRKRRDDAIKWLSDLEPDGDRGQCVLKVVPAWHREPQLTLDIAARKAGHTALDPAAP